MRKQPTSPMHYALHATSSHRSLDSGGVRCVRQVRHFDLREPSNGSRRLLHCRSGGRRSLRVRMLLRSAVYMKLFRHNIRGQGQLGAYQYPAVCRDHSASTR